MWHHTVFPHLLSHAQKTEQYQVLFISTPHKMPKLKSPEQININTQILSGVKEGQEIITEIQVKGEETADDSSNQESSPFAPGPKKNKKNNKK